MAKYNCENNFCVRVPYFPFNIYEKIEKIEFNKNIKKFTNKYFDENLKTLSTILYESIGDTHNKNVDMSLTKYLIRSSTRTTPYGLTSGVMLGSFQDESDLNFDGEFLKKARPDMEWLVKIIKICEKELKDELIIQKNTIYEKEGFRLVKTWNSCFIDNEESKGKRIQINYTRAVQKIFELSENPISIKNLIENLLQVYPDKNTAFLEEFINVLLDKEFLISNLRRGNEECNQFDKLLINLQKYQKHIDIMNDLLAIQELLKEYNTVKVSDGKLLYEEIVSKMSKIIEAKNYLQIDMYATQSIMLERKMQDEISEYAEFLSKISFNESYDKYVSNFLEKYGDQFVKLSDVVNDKQLGLPEVDNINSIKYNDQIMKIIISILLDNKNNKIDLYNYLDKFEDIYNKENVLFDSSELSFHLIKNKNGDYEYITTPLVGSDFAGKIMGRFNYLFNIKNQYPENIIDFSFVPENSRHYNVMSSIINSNAHLLNYGAFVEQGKKHIELSDIYIGIRNQRIHFFLRKENKEINFISSNMFVEDGYPLPLRTLIKITNNQKASLFQFYRTLLHIANSIPSLVIPEIRYKNFIIFPKIWKIDKKLFFRNNKMVSKSQFIESFKEYREKLKMPNRITVGPNDNKLILNLDNVCHLDILWSMLSKDMDLLLYDVKINLDNLLINNGTENKYIGEFIFKVDKDKNSLTEKIETINTHYTDLSEYYRLSKKFFSNWLYLKIYLKETLEEKVLISYVQDIYNSLVSKGYISNFFFIRYKDPDDHIRLRFNITEQNLYNVLEKIKKCLNDLIKSEIIYDYSFETYYPETNRYGGEECLPKAEVLFGADSISVLNLLSIHTNKLCSYTLEEIFIISAAQILNDFSIDRMGQIKLLENFTFGKKKSDEYNKIFRTIGSIIDDNSLLRNESQNIRILINFDERRIAYIKYWNKVVSLNSDNYEYQRDIILSIIHMHFNRIFGVNRGLEIRLMGYLRKIIYSVTKRRLYKDDKE